MLQNFRELSRKICDFCRMIASFPYLFNDFILNLYLLTRTVVE